MVGPGEWIDSPLSFRFLRFFYEIMSKKQETVHDFILKIMQTLFHSVTPSPTPHPLPSVRRLPILTGFLWFLPISIEIFSFW